MHIQRIGEIYSLSQAMVRRFVRTITEKAREYEEACQDHVHRWIFAEVDSHPHLDGLFKKHSRLNRA